MFPEFDVLENELSTEGFVVPQATVNLIFPRESRTLSGISQRASDLGQRGVSHFHAFFPVRCALATLDSEKDLSL